MAQDLTVRACPGCGASTRPDAPWCSQCYLDLRPAPPPPAAFVPTVATPRPRKDADGAPTWPCTACGTPSPLALDACSACGAGFLAQLREDEPPLLVLPVLGDVSRLGRGRLAAAACGAVLLVLLLCAAVAYLLG